MKADFFLLIEQKCFQSIVTTNLKPSENWLILPTLLWTIEIFIDEKHLKMSQTYKIKWLIVQLMCEGFNQISAKKYS